MIPRQAPAGRNCGTIPRTRGGDPVPETLLSEEFPEDVRYEIMPEAATPDRAALLAEKERLLARLTEIDKLLG